MKRLVLLAAGLGASAVFANSVNVQTYTPATNTSYNTTEDALLSDGQKGDKGKIKPVIGIHYNFVDDPLVETNEDITKEYRKLVTHINTLNIQAGTYFLDRLYIGLDAPAHMVATDNNEENFALGDATLRAKVRINDPRSSLGIALIPELYLPSGDKNYNVSNDSTGGGLKLAVENKFKYFSAAVNVGYQNFSNSRFKNLDYRNRIPISLGINIPLSEKNALLIDAGGSLILPLNDSQNPGEANLSLQRKLNANTYANIGGGVGKVEGAGSVDYRIFAGIKILPFAHRKAPVVVQQIKVVKAAPKRKKVVFTPKRIILNEEIKFLHNSDILTKSGRELLDEVATTLKQNRKSYKKIIIEGHTNRIGTKAYNIKLSIARASAVKEYITSRGLSKKIFDVKGYGESIPKELKNISKKAKLNANRRVEFKVVQ